MKKNLEERFNDFIATGILDLPENEFQEYEICITEFDNKIKTKDLRGLNHVNKT